MEKNEVVILGGGISGLTLRYYLSQTFPDLKITLCEKKKKIGGLIGSEEVWDFFFEKSARTFKISRSQALLQLIDELQLRNEIITSDPKGSRRYILHQKKLLPLGGSRFFFTSFFRRLLPALLTEWIRPRGKAEDESVHDFATRRFGSFVATTLFDPLTLGIYGGSTHTLSILSAFPELHAMEKNYGSLTFGLLEKMFRRKEKGESALFTLKGGMEVLLQKLAAKGRGEVLTDFEVSSIERKGARWVVSDGKKEREGDFLYSALSAKDAGRLFNFEPLLHSFFSSLEHYSLRVVQFGYRNYPISWEGLGYLVPSGEMEDILGVIVDSSVFPQQSKKESEMRLSVFMGGAFHPRIIEEKEAISIKKAFSSLRKDLNIEGIPEVIKVRDYPHALPQYRVGHKELVRKLDSYLKENPLSLDFVGNYLSGIGVEECISLAKEKAFSFVNERSS
ncbi:MAG: protoporphyrinogen oxidase [Simkania negevensis]|nr:protoporphyrinogen oxidase [Simkania negevensis]